MHIVIAWPLSIFSACNNAHAKPKEIKVWQWKNYQDEIMEVKKKVSAGKLCTVGGALLLSAFSTMASAASYESSVVLPTVFSRNFTETAYLPVTGSPPANGVINNVTWNWNVVGFPSGLSVALCQGSTSNCIDVSRVRSMSTTAFNNKSPSQQFFFALRVSGSGQVPVAGQLGKIKVSWN